MPQQAICEWCETSFEFLASQKRGRFCSNRCQHDYRHHVVNRTRFEEGLIFERSSLRVFLIEDRGDKCEVCGIADWNGKQITFQVDHVDGDAGNNMPSNLRLICPNCHSQTTNFGGANKGSGRKAKNLPLR